MVNSAISGRLFKPELGIFSALFAEAMMHNSGFKVVAMKHILGLSTNIGRKDSNRSLTILANFGNCTLGLTWIAVTHPYMLGSDIDK